MMWEPVKVRKSYSGSARNCVGRCGSTPETSWAGRRCIGPWRHCFSTMSTCSWILDESHFAQLLESSESLPLDEYGWLIGYKVSALLAIVERLERGGYELDRSDALKIMQTFVEYDLFRKPANFAESCHDREEFAKAAKETIIKPSLTLYELLRSSPGELAKRFTHEEYFELKTYRTLDVASRTHGLASLYTRTRSKECRENFSPAGRWSLSWS
ncbi:unnamed protein product [Trichogramma brassicae]|uniref:Uncharacterized protein n=1 Tax=Trichogramma brassicae TaxID=86971 RepID=A0A6H5HY65_9HYME|nr:unnamed protein product [Trichogramma brassicae]